MESINSVLSRSLNPYSRLFYHNTWRTVKSPLNIMQRRGLCNHKKISWYINDNLAFTTEDTESHRVFSFYKLMTDTTDFDSLKNLCETLCPLWWNKLVTAFTFFRTALFIGVPGETSFHFEGWRWRTFRCVWQIRCQCLSTWSIALSTSIGSSEDSTPTKYHIAGAM